METPADHCPRARPTSAGVLSDQRAVGGFERRPRAYELRSWVEIFLGEAAGITALEVALTETTKNKGWNKKQNKGQSALKVGKCNYSSCLTLAQMRSRLGRVWSSK
jgi:hypothetical protein